MNETMKVPAVVAAVVIALLVLGFSVRKSLDNGERPNPNAGHPVKIAVGGLSRSESAQMTEDTYKQLLKQNRPDLNDAEIQQKADNWWKIKTGQISLPQTKS